MTSKSSVRWKPVLACVLLIVAAALLWPQVQLPHNHPLLIALAAGALLFQVRKRWLDVGFLLACVMAAEQLVESDFAPLLLLMLLMVALALSMRPWFSALLAMCVVGLLWFSAQMKLRFAGSALTWQDAKYFFRQFADNVGVMRTQPTLLLAAAGALSVLVAALVFAWWKDGAVSRQHAPATLKRSAALRVCAVALAAATAFVFFNWTERARPQVPWVFSEAKFNRPVSAFFSTLNLQPKADYRRVDTRSFAADVGKLVRESAGKVTKADIVVFLQESQFNPVAIEGCPASVCQIGVFDADAGTSDHGALRVHVFGGGTWMTEFTFQTGIPHTVFGQAGDFAPFNMAPGTRRSFVRSLKAAGYHTVAVYPVRGGMMNARAAYRAYGFDEFLDAADLGLVGGFETTDEDIHASARKALASGRQLGKPVFVMAVTIFNHSEHGILMNRVPDTYRAASRAVPATRGEQDNIADYMWRTQLFADAYARTRQNLANSPRPLVLAWFGDHQPPFGSALPMRERVKGIGGAFAPARFQTWYDIHSNISPAGLSAPKSPLDIAFLPGLLAQRAQLPLDEWLAANVLARERCASLLVECRDPTLPDIYLSYLLDDLAAFAP